MRFLLVNLAKRRKKKKKRNCVIRQQALSPWGFCLFPCLIIWDCIAFGRKKKEKRKVAVFYRGKRALNAPKYQF